VYIGEFASKEIRGILLTFFESSVKIGILFAYVIGYLFSQTIMNSICGALVILFTIIFMFVPETPMYLVGKSELDRAKLSIKYLRGNSYDAQKEITELQRQFNEIESTKVSFVQEIQKKATRKAFIIVFFLFVFFQLSGINPVVFYSTNIFIEANIKLDPFFATVILGVVQVTGVFVATFYIDKYGRKILLAISFVMMVIGLSGIGIYFTLKNMDISVHDIEMLPLIMLGLFLVGFSLGVGSITFVLVGELFSQNAKKIISPAVQTVNVLMSFTVTMIYPTLASIIGLHFTFFIFASFCLVGLIFVLIVLPETKGKSLYDIQKLLTNE
jgi:SP family facilitated glucose transporter-like MFS transporter 8